MLVKQPLAFVDATLRVTRYQKAGPKPVENILKRGSDREVAEQEYATSNTATTASDDDVVPLLEVLGIPPGTKRQMVELFFESAKESGGGDIKQLDYHEGDGRAQIMFEKKEGKGTVWKSL